MYEHVFRSYLQGHFSIASKLNNENLQGTGEDSSIFIDYNLVWMYTILLSSNQ